MDLEITDSELDAIEARAAAALPGPWESSIEGRDHDSGDDVILTGGPNDDAPDLYVTLVYRNVPGQRLPTTADWDFIANARQDVPKLVAEVRRLRSGRDKAT